MYVIFAILLLGIIILVHELGHFLAATLSGVMVKEFSLFFGPALYQKKFGETVYSIRTIPLGGYVQMLGEHESSDDPRSFEMQRKLKRFFILIAGVGFNTIFGVFLLGVLNMADSPYMLPTVKVFEKSPASESLKDGDRIISIDGERIENWQDIMVYLGMNANDLSSVKIKFLRGRKVDIAEIKLQKDEKSGKMVLGIAPFGDIAHYSGLSFFPAMKKGVFDACGFLWLNFQGIKKIASGKMSAKDNLAGPVGIVHLSSKVVESGWMNTLKFLALLNILIALFNLLPIPMLDGGHIMFLGIEAIRGKPISRPTQAALQFVFLILLLGFVLLVTCFDVMRIFS